MKYKFIYYPEYELEYSGLIKKQTPLNHILNIRLLMFLCDHVVLPPSHLLNISNDNILSLITYLQGFFYAGKIVTTHYSSGIEDYFYSRIERIQDPIVKKAKSIQVDQIKKDLLHSEVVYNRSDEGTQLFLFDSHLKDLIQNSSVSKKKSILLLNHIQAISDKTGDPIYSNQFRAVIKDLLINQDITKQQSRYFLNLMSRTYYSIGTYTMNTLVSYNDYFSQIDLHNSLLETHKGATNLIVDPHFLRKLFDMMGISSQDLNRLTVVDYQTIMSLKAWENFMTICDRLYSNAQDLEELLKNRELTLAAYKKKKEKAFKLLDVATIDLFLPTLLSSSPAPVGIGVLLVISLLRKFLPLTRKFESFVQRNTTDKIVNRIEQCNDPLLEFGYRLNEFIQELK